MSNPPIKCAAKDYNKDPFYLIQKNGNDKRYVVALNEKIRIRTLIAGFINKSQSAIEIKIRNLEDRDNPVDYSGEVARVALHKIMTKNEDVIFHNGYHDFMIRNPESGDYLAFDEHGLIFLYTDDDYSEVLNNLGAEYKSNENLIYEYDHWHYLMPEGRERLAELINDLTLKKE